MSSETNLLNAVNNAAENQLWKQPDIGDGDIDVEEEELAKTLKAEPEECNIPQESRDYPSSPVNLDDTVTLNSSDLSSTNSTELDDIVDVETVDDDVVDVVTVSDNVLAALEASILPVPSNQNTDAGNQTEEIEIIPITVTPAYEAYEGGNPVSNANNEPMVEVDIIEASTANTTSAAPKASEPVVEHLVTAASQSTQNALDELERTIQSHEAENNIETVSLTSDTIVSKSAERITEELAAIEESFHSVENAAEIKLTSQEAVAEVYEEETGTGNDSEVSSDSMSGNQSITADSGIGLSSATTSVTVTDAATQSKTEEIEDNKHNGVEKSFKDESHEVDFVEVYLRVTVASITCLMGVVHTCLTINIAANNNN